MESEKPLLKTSMTALTIKICKIMSQLKQPKTDKTCTKRNQSIWKRLPLSITEILNLFPSLQNLILQRPLQEDPIVLILKIKVINNLRFKKQSEELLSRILLFIMRKNLQSGTKNKIERFLESNPKIVKNLFKTMKSNPEQRNMPLSLLKETNPESVKHTKEALPMKDHKSPKEQNEIMTEVHWTIPNIYNQRPMRDKSEKKFQSLEVWKWMKTKDLFIRAHSRQRLNNTRSSWRSQEAERSLKENHWANAWKDQTTKTLRREGKESWTNLRSWAFQALNQRWAQYHKPSQILTIRLHCKLKSMRISVKSQRSLLLTVHAWKNTYCRWIQTLTWIQKIVRRGAFLCHWSMPRDRKGIETRLRILDLRWMEALLARNSQSMRGWMWVRQKQGSRIFPILQGLLLSIRRKHKMQKM